MKKMIPFVLLLCACGANPPHAEPSIEPNTEPNANSDTTISAPSDADAQQGSAPQDADPQPITDVTRAQLNDVLKKGPANILAMVQTDSILKNGKFVGFKIVSFRIDAPTVLGIHPEDIVRRVNKLPIERPEQFLKIFDQLKTATEIEFTVIRNGKELVLKTPIQ